MKHITTGEHWLFEIKAVRAIRAEKYGDPYSAIATITIVDDELHVEGLLDKNADGFSKADLIEIESEILRLGFTEYFYLRYKNGEKIKIKK